MAHNGGELEQELIQSLRRQIEERGIGVDSPEGQQVFLQMLESELPEAARAAADVFRASIRETSADVLASAREMRQQFVEQNYSKWQTAFDLLETICALATEIGGKINTEHRPQAAIDGDLQFDVLVRLHARGCLISQECLALLRAGFPDGAEARWRALHEVSVVSRFLFLMDQEASRRFLVHQWIEMRKSALLHRKLEARIAETGPTDQEMAELDRIRSDLIAEFGRDFDEPYGWAKPYLAGRPANLAVLEAEVGLDHLRPYYKAASHNVHATPRSLKAALAMADAREPMLLVGPSDSGMTHPAHCVAISLSAVTSSLLTKHCNLDNIAWMHVLKSLSDEVGAVFLATANAGGSSRT